MISDTLSDAVVEINKYLSNSDIYKNKETRKYIYDCLEKMNTTRLYLDRIVK